MEGELTLADATRPISLRRSWPATTGRSPPRAVVKQSDWGMKPYSALFGALKVLDEVEVELSAQSR